LIETNQKLKAQTKKVSEHVRISKEKEEKLASLEHYVEN
jgi:hypothetical protein